MYNPFWNKTITIFTPVIKQDTLKWYKYEKKNSFFRTRSSKSSSDLEYVKDNRSIIRINADNYITYSLWRTFDDVIKLNKFSISDESILIPHTVLEIIEDNDSGSFLFDKYQCCKPLSITENIYFHTPHILIVGD